MHMSSMRTATSVSPTMSAFHLRVRSRELESMGGSGGIARSFGTHQREQDDVADRRLTGEQHRHAIDADALARRRRHADLERATVVLVVVHRLFGTGGLRRGLRLEPRALIVGIVELGEAIRELLAAHEQLEAIAE